MSDKKTYLGYISYFIKNIAADELSNSEYKKFFKKYIGSDDVGEAKTSKLKEIALIFYYSHFLRMALCIKLNEIINSGKSSKELKDTLIDANKVRKEHGFRELPVVFHIKEDDVLKHMGKMQESPAFLKDNIKIKSPVKKAIKKARKPKSPVKSGAKSTKSKKATSPKAKKTTTKTTVSKNTGCNALTLDVVKKMATKAQISGRSKMKKDELCKALIKLGKIKK